jgi:hypothetical protein
MISLANIVELTLLTTLFTLMLNVTSNLSFSFYDAQLLT